MPYGKRDRQQAKVLIDDVYKGGKRDGEHELLSTAISAGLFHWNCRHSYIVFIPGYSRENIFDYDRASKELTAERYAIEQEQRRNERSIREWKRIEQGSMNETDRLLARQKIAEWQAKQRALEKYAEEKRIPFYRQYQREAIGGETKPILPSVTNAAIEKGIKPGIDVKEIEWQREVDVKIVLAETKEDKQRAVRRLIVSRDIPINISQQKQNKHIEGTKEYARALESGNNPSIITNPNPQRIVNEYAGYGEIQFRKGKWDRTEIVATDEIIGYTTTDTGDRYYTKKAKIHYSKTGTHIVPYFWESRK